MPIAEMVAVLMNIGLASMGVDFWTDDNRVSMRDFFIYSSIVFVPLVDIYIISRRRRNNDERATGLLGMYLQRRKLEEQKRIRELEKEL